MRAFILAVTGLALVIACSSGGTSVVQVDNPQVAAVKLTLPAPSLIKGQTARATATALDVNGAPLANRPISWSSAPASIATIDDSGMISAVAPGAATITATSEGKSGSQALAVVDPAPAPVATVSVSPTSPSVQIGGTVQLAATTRDAGNNILTGRAVAWSSSDAGIATVSSAGLVSAVAAGSATVTATSEGQSGTATVSVTAAPPPPPVPVASVGVSLAASSINPGQTTQATATTRDSNNNVLTGRTIAWSSSNPSVATVSSSGLVTAVAVGTAQIVATSEGKSGNATLTVSAPPPVPVASVSVSLAASSRNPGQTTQATATTRDANNNVLTGRSIAWSSSNTGVATVSGSGLVTAVAVGTAQITATSEGKSGSATLTVTAPAPVPVASVSVSLAASSVTPGQTTQATATTRDANNNVLTGRTIAWSSNNTALATVSGSGLVTAVTVGTAQITATSEGQSGSATLTINSPPPPPPPGSSNEPAGMTLYTDRPFNGFQESGWSDDLVFPQGGSLSIVADATAPKSPSNIMRVTYPTGFTSVGVGPGAMDFNLSSRPRTLYIQFWCKLSTNFYNHDSGYSKQFYVYANGLPLMYFAQKGSTYGTLTPVIVLQDTYSHGTAVLNPNLVPTAQIIRGQWQRFEVILVGNTAGAQDGSADWYLDGVHIGSHSIQWQSGAAPWERFHFDAVWGGTGGPNVPATMTLDWDHVYLSGKN